VVQRVLGGLGSQSSMTFGTRCDEIVSLTHRPPLLPGNVPGGNGCVDPSAMELSEGNMSLKNPLPQPGNDPGTVRLVAQHLNHCATPDPFPNRKKYFFFLFFITAQIRLSRLIGTTSHPHMRKIRINGFSSENRLHWQLEVEKKFYKRLL